MNFKETLFWEKIEGSIRFWAIVGLVEKRETRFRHHVTLIKKDNQIFLIYKEIQSGAVAKSYMRQCFLIYEETRKYFPIYEEAVSLSHIWLCNCSILNSLLYEENLIFFFISVINDFSFVVVAALWNTEIRHNLPFWSASSRGRACTEKISRNQNQIKQIQLSSRWSIYTILYTT